MQTGPFSLLMALAAGAVLAVLWAGFVAWVLYLVATRPELDRKRYEDAGRNGSKEMEEAC